MTMSMNPYDLYRHKEADAPNGTEVCIDPSNCPAMKELNEGYLTMSKYASFNRRHKNDHRRIPVNHPTSRIDHKTIKKVHQDD